MKNGSQAAVTPPVLGKTVVVNSLDGNNINFVPPRDQRAQAVFRWLLGRG